VRANSEASEEEHIQDTELLAQISSLTFAAYDTTSSALARILHLLAEEPEVQNRLRQELTTAREEKGDMSYEDLFALPLLDAVCRETLRLYPPAPLLFRTALEDVILPMTTPVKSVDGKTMLREIAVTRGTTLIISILGANRSTEIWGPDAAEWKPERWMAPLPASVAEAALPGVYSRMMTFLGGNKSCPGFQFSQLEMKVVLLILLTSFEFALPEQDEVEWHLGFLQTPHVKGAADQSPQLPLKVSLLSK